MFTPNGAGTVEWRLGWAVDLPQNYFLLVMPCDPPGPVHVPVGVLSSRITARMADDGGMSIAIRPDGLTPVRRGQPIARAVPLHADSLQAAAEYGPTSADHGTENG